MNARADIILFQCDYNNHCIFSKQVMYNISYHFVSLIRDIVNLGLSVFEMNQCDKHLHSLTR